MFNKLQIGTGFKDEDLKEQHKLLEEHKMDKVNYFYFK